ncbi:MAG: hypothetical protein ACRERC_20205 [Candidatus Binatia bacterium]
MRRFTNGGLRCGLLLLVAPAVAAAPVDTALPTPTPTATAMAPCVGDCNGNGVVTINELIVGVNIALGNAPVTTCPAFDPNHDGKVGINELIAAVNNSLYGCGVMPPTRLPTATVTDTPTAVDTATPTAVDTATATPTPTAAATRTRTPTATPTVPMSVCGGFVAPLPVLCNLTVIPNPVSRAGTIAFRFGVSDLDGNISQICIQLTHPPFEPETSCTPLVPVNRVINAFQTTSPVSASPLAFGGYDAAVQAFDTAGNRSNIITAAFQVQ